MGDVVDFIADAVNAVFDFVSSLIGGIFNSLFGGLFEQPQVGDNRNQTVTVQQADVPRRFVFGVTRLGMVVIERAKPDTESETLYFAGLFCQGPSEVQALYWGEELLCLESAGLDSNGVEILIPKTELCFVVETRWMGASRLDYVADQASLDAIGSTHNGDPVMRKFTVDSSKYMGFMEVRKYDGTQTFADADMLANLPHWTAAHRLEGISYAVFKLERSNEVFPRGVDNISARIEGIQVLDPRDGQTKWTQNPALLWYWWKTDEIWGRAVPTTDIDIEAVKLAADICDESVSTIYGGTEPRYSAHGVFDTGREPSEFEKDILASMDGVSANLGGMETLIAGKHVEPTFTIERRHAIGSITSNTRLARKDQVEVVKGTYLAPDNNWKKTSFPAVKATPNAVTDEKVINLDLRLVSSPSQAQRLAMRNLKRARLERRMSGAFDGEAIRAISGRPVMIEMGDRFPLSGKQAMILGWGLTVDKDGRLGVQMSMRETSPEVDTFDAATDERPVTIGAKTDEDAPQVARPITDPQSGILSGVNYPIDITISTPTFGATIRWSRGLNIETVTDGNAYTGPISVEKDEVIVARAFKDGFVKSSPLFAVFGQAMVMAPQASLSPGDFPLGFFPADVELTSQTPGAQIRYSLTAPVNSSTAGTAYTGPVTIPAGGGTLYARAFKDGWWDSDAVTFVYTES